MDKKRIKTLVNWSEDKPNTFIQELADKVQAIADKYKITYEAVQTEIKETEAILCDLIDELDGKEFEMKGLDEFKSLLKGN